MNTLIAIVALCVTLGWFCITTKLCGVTAKFRYKLLILIGASVTWWYSFDFNYDITYSRSYTTTKTLVSASPSESYLEGSFQIFMGTGGGSVETKRWYLLREELRHGLYKDLTVKKDVFIEERDNLPKGKGLFEQNFTCNKHHTSYRMFLWTIEDVDEKCAYQSQTIVVPRGFVIKEIRI